MADVIVVGAGIAGALAARELGDAGHRVTVLDKSFAPGGRLASRRIGGATFDVGAQFLTARSPAFTALVEAWVREGVVRTWFHGGPDEHAPDDPDGHPRFRGVPTMRRIVEHLAAPLELRLGTIVGALNATQGRWQVDIATRARDTSSRPVSPPGPQPRRTLEADAVLVTTPIPQTRDLLTAGGTQLSPDAHERLAAATYDPCLTVLAVPDGPTALPARGAVRLGDGEVSWITDHQVSGASATPAVTIHASDAYSINRFDAPAEVVSRELTAAAGEVLGCEAQVVHLHRWRYATPTTAIGTEPMLERVASSLIAFAGDAFGGGRVEGAALSGLRTAQALDGALRERTAR